MTRIYVDYINDEQGSPSDERLDTDAWRFASVRGTVERFLETERTGWMIDIDGPAPSTIWRANGSIGDPTPDDVARYERDRITYDSTAADAAEEVAR